MVSRDLFDNNFFYKSFAIKIIVKGCLRNWNYHTSYQLKSIKFQIFPTLSYSPFNLYFCYNNANFIFHLTRFIHQGFLEIPQPRQIKIFIIRRTTRIIFSSLQDFHNNLDVERINALGPVSNFFSPTTTSLHQFSGRVAHDPCTSPGKD